MAQLMLAQGLAVVEPLISAGPATEHAQHFAGAEIIPLQRTLTPARRHTPSRAAKSWIRPGRTLMVASGGGHIDELVQLRERMLPELDEVEWVTFRTPQTMELLAGEIVHWIPVVGPKDARGTMSASSAAARILEGQRFARVISTGAAVAVPFMARARLRGLAAHYIESAARTSGLSMSGAMVAKMPGVRMYGQYPTWTSGRVQYRGSVFDTYSMGPRLLPQSIDRVVVTMGTQQGFGFRRAVEHLIRLLPGVCSSSPTVLWQTGATDLTGLAVEGRGSVPAAELRQAVAEADLVIGHAGVGTSLLALEQGRCPVLLPRSAAHDEHTDDHQGLLADDLQRRGLAIGVDPDDLHELDLLEASTMTAMVATSRPDFVLQPD